MLKSIISDVFICTYIFLIKFVKRFKSNAISLPSEEEFHVFGRLPQDLCLLTTGAQKLFIGYNEEIKKKLLEPAMEIELLFGIYDMNNHREGTITLGA
jgi:hypothetical protein